MKLRNKKTGEIIELKLIKVNDKYLRDHEVDLLDGEKITLKSLIDSFDDANEPLIKDEKIRKAVRAWAEANNMSCCHYECGEFEQEYAEIGAGISFGEKTDYLEERHYTLTELCGEGE